MVDCWLMSSARTDGGANAASARVARPMLRSPVYSLSGASRRRAGSAISGARADALCARAADRDAIDPQGWLADADRHTLAVLAASADAGVKRKVVADHGDPVQVGWPVADQHGALDRRVDLAVVDAISLGALEDVFAGRDVDLPAAEAHRIDAVLHRRDDLIGF